MRKNTKSYEKILVLLLIFIFVFSPLTARRADAQWVVFDPAVFGTTLTGQLKDYGFDAIAWIVVNLVIERISASTVNWINSGFQGSPAFVTDPAGYYKQIGDDLAGAYILSNPNLDFLCGPISARVRLALAETYAPDPEIRWQCTLTDAVGNMEDFLDDFNKGGWDKFFELSQRPQNNPLGAYLQAESELLSSIANRQSVAQQELTWGQGFMSFKKCAPGSEIVNAAGDGTTCDPADLETVTPGSVIEGQLNSVLGSGTRKLEVADEINEIVSALLTQLLNRVVGGIGRGLRGASESSGGQASFTSGLTERRPGAATGSVEGYFGCPQPGDANYDPEAYCDRQNLDALEVDTESSGGFISRPRDPDCDAYTDLELLDMARERARFLSDITGRPYAEVFSEIINNSDDFDCPVR